LQYSMIENNSIEYKGLKKIIDNNGKLKTEGIRELAVICVSFANVQGAKTNRTYTVA